MKKGKSILYTAVSLAVLAGLAICALIFCIPGTTGVDVQIAEKLVNPDAGAEAVSLYADLRAIYGRKIISGHQTWSFRQTPGGFEDKVILQKTGRLPYLNGFDFLLYTAYGDASQIDAAISWHQDRGGIVAFCWHWLVPGQDGGLTYEGSKTDFEVSRAVIGDTDENTRLMKDLKKTADGLELLGQSGVPVLWRPMHEADLGYFWWSKGGPAAYVKLWDIMFHYFVDERGLDNLIWVWNGQSKAWLVPSDQFDIVSMDIYPRTKIDRSSHVRLFRQSQAMAPTKMVALSECEFIPEPDLLINDGAKWLWYMSWHTSYVYVPNSEIDSLPARSYALNEKYINKADLTRIMNNDYVLTLPSAQAEQEQGSQTGQ